MRDEVRIHLTGLFSRHPALQPVEGDLVAGFERLVRCFTNAGTLFVCGNGGSAADSEHIVGELVKGFLLRRAPTAAARARIIAASPGEDAEYVAARVQCGLRAVALTGHGALSTAVINDIGGDMVFAQQLYALSRPGDMLLGISTSGNARNVGLAARIARGVGVGVIGLTGRGGGALGALADVCICVPAVETFEVQEQHLAVYHALCAMLEAERFPPE